MKVEHRLVECVVMLEALLEELRKHNCDDGEDLPSRSRAIALVEALRREMEAM